MFIDWSPLPLWRHSEGRSESSNSKSEFIPPLRMAPEVRHRCGYKHLTPPGLNPTQDCLLSSERY